MTNLLLDVEPPPPAPRCPHCAALEARVERLREYIAGLEHDFVEVCRFVAMPGDYEPFDVKFARTACGLQHGDLTDAPERTEVAL